MFRLTIAIFAGLVASAYAACDNACSGHGTCGIKDVCTCWQDWRMGDEIGGDCSDRQCPFELAWVDAPDHSGKFHKYLECAGRGICDRTTGECGCFDGYTGKACARTTCPNDCSGHGTCQYIEDLGFPSVFGAYYNGSGVDLHGIGDQLVTFTPTSSQLWDQGKTRGCLCDPLYTDVDCSRRMCPKGTDVLHERMDTTDKALYQVQTIKFFPSYLWNATSSVGGDQYSARIFGDYSGSGTPATVVHPHTSFALKFKSKLNETYITRPIMIGFNTTNLQANYLPQLAEVIEESLEELPHQVISDVFVTVSGTDTSGFGDDDATTVTASPPDLQIQITFTGATVQGPQNLLGVVDYPCGDGCTPKITGIPLTSVYTLSTVYESTPSDFNNYECGRRGKCDYDTGLCACFDGYTGEACGTQTALI